MRNDVKAITRAYGDGTINLSELQRLETILQDDSNARRQFLREMNLIDALEELALAGPGAPLNQTRATPSTEGPTSRAFAWTPWASFAVLAASLLIISGFVWLTSSRPSIGTVAELHGEVRWTGQDGVVVNQLATGDSLPGGTLESLAADAWASFRFHDGSIVTLSGEAEAVLSDINQKQLHLRRGSLSADVVVQPAGSPMVVRTPAAEIQVLGREFNLNVRNTETELVVNDGRVSFLRSSDGKVLEVPAEHLAIASLDAAEAFVFRRREPHTTTWRSLLEDNADVMHGYWKPALFELESKLKLAVGTGDMTEAEALAEYKQAVDLNNLGSVWAKPSKIGCLVWLDVRSGEGRRVLLTEKTQIRVAGRLLASTNLQMGVSTYAVDGGFSGKYSRSISPQELNRSAEGEFDWVINVDDLAPKSDGSAIGLLVQDWWCVAESNTAKLKIVRVEIYDR